jgi:hypothetical protein
MPILYFMQSPSVGFHVERVVHNIIMVSVPPG